MILFVGDGMSQEIQSIAEHQMVQAKWLAGARKPDGTPYTVSDQTAYKLTWRKKDWAKVYVATHSYDDFVPDSASTASAMCNGEAQCLCAGCHHPISLAQSGMQSLVSWKVQL